MEVLMALFGISEFPASPFLHFGAITKQNKGFLEHKHCITMTVDLITEMATK
jgi:hypothetical protein